VQVADEKESQLFLSLVRFLYDDELAIRAADELVALLILADKFQGLLPFLDVVSLISDLFVFAPSGLSLISDHFVFAPSGLSLISNRFVFAPSGRIGAAVPVMSTPAPYLGHCRTDFANHCTIHRMRTHEGGGQERRELLGCCRIQGIGSFDMIGRTSQSGLCFRLDLSTFRVQRQGLTLVFWQNFEKKTLWRSPEFVTLKLPTLTALLDRYLFSVVLPLPLLPCDFFWLWLFLRCS
jgi:hypothetical protein